MRTRTEHLDYCKKIALDCIDRDGDCMNGLTSMFSDLEKHPETAGHPGTVIGVKLMMMGLLSTPSEARRFIKSFN